MATTVMKRGHLKGEPDRSHSLTLPPLLLHVCSQCGRREVPSDPLCVRQLLWLCEELPTHAGGAGLQPGVVRLSI